MDKKISQLIAAGPLTGSELLPLVQSGVTKQTTLSDIQEAQSVTYAEAMSLIGTSSLVPGKTYLLSDFQTKHYIVDGNGNPDTSTIITGATEPLVLTAASTSEFSPVASSTTFPQDIIHIDLNPNNWLLDLSFADVYGTGDIIPGFKGVITYREDTKNKNTFYFDFRNCKFRRWKIDVADWDSAAAYVEGNLVVENDRLYVASNSSTNQPPFAGSSFWVRIANLEKSRYLSNTNFAFGFFVGTVGIPIDVNDYQDVKMFVEDGPTGTYEASVFANKFGNGLKDTDDFYEILGTFLPNNVIYLSDNGYFNLYGNLFNGSFFGNTIVGADYFVNNISQQYFSFNLISGDNVWNNTFSGRVYSNVINNNFSGNIAASTFESNTFGGGSDNSFLGRFNNNLFTSGSYNSFLGEASSNKLKDNFSSNTVETQFSNNNLTAPIAFSTFGPFFRNNQVNSGLTMAYNTFGSDVAALNFSSATHVFATYGCTISKKPDSTFALSYIDNTNTQVIVAATA